MNIIIICCIKVLRNEGGILIRSLGQSLLETFNTNANADTNTIRNITINTNTVVSVLELPLISKESMMLFTKGKFSNLSEKVNSFFICRGIKKVLQLHASKTFSLQEKMGVRSPIRHKQFNKNSANYVNNINILFSKDIYGYISVNDVHDVCKKFGIIDIQTESARILKELTPIIMKRIIRKRPRPENVAILAKQNDDEVKYWAAEMSKHFKEVILFVDKTDELEEWREEFCYSSGAVMAFVTDSRVIRKCDIVLDLCGGAATTDIVRKALASTTIINFGNSYVKHVKGKVICSNTIHITPPSDIVRAISHKADHQFDLTELSIMLLNTVYKDRILEGFINGKFEFSAS